MHLFSGVRFQQLKEQMKKFIIVAACLVSLNANAMTEDQAELQRVNDRVSVAAISACIAENEMNVALKNAAMKYDAELKDCFTDNTKNIKDRYRKFDAGIKNKAVKATFKDYYIAVLAQVKAFEVIRGETEHAYDSRQRAAKERTNEAWVRVEVEMGF